MHTEHTLQPKKNEAKIGDMILFERNDHMYEGTVFLIRENSVLVDISKDAAEELGYEQPNTVVGHGKYTIIHFPEEIVVQEERMVF